MGKKIQYVSIKVDQITLEQASTLPWFCIVGKICKMARLKAFHFHLGCIPVLSLGLCLHEFVCLLHTGHLRPGEARDDIMKLKAKQLQPTPDV